ncbi:hypothetical protein BD413DRAFT_181809 [Trametes elegans]|nr:hypothetical protein BD413DRAFT_181809 [Trametes elegans]
MRVVYVVTILTFCLRAAHFRHHRTHCPARSPSPPRGDVCLSAWCAVAELRRRLGRPGEALHEPEPGTIHITWTTARAHTQRERTGEHGPRPSTRGPCPVSSKRAGEEGHEDQVQKRRYRTPRLVRTVYKLSSGTSTRHGNLRRAKPGRTPGRQGSARSAGACYGRYAVYARSRHVRDDAKDARARGDALAGRLVRPRLPRCADSPAGGSISSAAARQPVTPACTTVC